MKRKLNSKNITFNYLFKVLLISLFTSFTSHSQILNNYQEKVYLHFDKADYASGDIIWFKAHVVDAKTNQPIVVSKILYVDLIDPLGKILISRVLEIDQGGAAGDFQLPINLLTGKYRIRAYTNYMRNFDAAYFFRKSIHISNLGPIEVDSITVNSIGTTSTKKKSDSLDFKPDLQFFPEGGHMVNGILNSIGFKAVGIDGKGISVSGSISDQNGAKIVAFNTLKFGMGILEFTPNQSKNYSAQIKYQGINYSYNLPKALPTGVVMHVENHKDVFEINLKSSLPEGIKGLVVIGKQGDDIVCRSEIQESGFKATVNIPKEYLDQGIVQFTVFDKNKNPQCERLVFVEKKEIEPKVTLVSAKNTYKKRELIELHLSLSSPLKPQANMSIAVTDNSVVQLEKNRLNIKSYVLLNSELKGTIEQPNYYFESKAPERKQMLNALLMTQGWRQYLWNNVPFDTLQKMKFEIEKGFTLSGTVYKFNNPNKTEHALVTLMTMNESTINKFEINTNDHGKFRFGPYAISDSITVIIKAKKTIAKDMVEKKGSNKPTTNYTIEMDTNEMPEVHNSFKNESVALGTTIYDSIDEATSVVNKNINIQYNERSRSRQNYDSIIKFEKGTIHLDEVVLKEEKTKSIALKLNEIREKKRDVLAKNPSHTLSFKELIHIPSNPLEALQGRIPGVKIVQQADLLSFKAYTRGYSDKRYMRTYLNGVFINDLSFIDSNNIDFIDVIKPPRSYIYGANGHFGVIMIYTKDAETEILIAEEKALHEKQPEFTRFMHPGYYHSKEFYSPVYTTNQTTEPDYRSTLYWNPNVKLNENGEAKILFYAADIATTYSVVLEGLTIDGVPFVQEISIEIKD